MRKAMAMMTTCRKIVLLTLVAIIIIIIASIEVPLVKAPIQDPTDEEKAIYTTKRNRYKDLGQKSVTDILNSLGADGTGQWVSIGTKHCSNHTDYDECEIIIKTRLVHFDCSIPPSDADGKFGRESATTTIENRVKKLKIIFFIMINPNLAKEAEKSSAGQIDDDRLFYHELLHGQIMVDQMKDPNWAGWDKLCECKPLSEWGDMIGAGDRDHKVIPGLEEDYRDKIAADRGYTLAVDHKVTKPDEKKEFSVEVIIPANILDKENPTIDWYGWRVEGVAVDQDGNKIKIGGKVEKDSDRGKIWIYFDPDNKGMIIHLEIGESVGGYAFHGDKTTPLATWIGLASMTVTAAVLATVYAKRRKRR